MEVLVRNLDELVDLLLVFLEDLRWRSLRARYPAVLACLLYSSATTPADSPTIDFDTLEQSMVAAAPDRIPTHTP